MKRYPDIINVYKQMLLIRKFEEAVEKLFSRGLIKGTAHPSIGQEAVALGIALSIKKGDYVTSTHRGHGHFLALGGNPSKMMAELFGKASGYCGGKGGSQLMADPKIGFMGSNGITGAGIPFATGIGLSIKLQQKKQVAICLFGDGAASQGMFHESLNMASLWNLPVVYVCENNHYAMSTPVNETIAGGSIAKRASSYNMPGITVDGNDVFAVQEAVSSACARARRGNGPSLIECITYRMSGHSRGDMCIYRPKEEYLLWQKKDPIRKLFKKLHREGILNASINKKIKREVTDIIHNAIKFARKSPYPEFNSMLINGVPFK